ncbi:MAG: 50S ribosomal protein L22 [archaeon]
MEFKYAFGDVKENMAKAVGKSLPISTKKSVEISNAIRGKSVLKAKAFLRRVLNMESAVPMKRYNQDTPHRPGIGPGKYPIKAVQEILMIIESAEANAQNKGLSTNDLIIEHISAHKASTPYHYGRQKRSKMKRTHIQILLLEKKMPKKEGDKK